MPVLGPDGLPLKATEPIKPRAAVDVADAMLLASTQVGLVETPDGRDLILLELGGVVQGTEGKELREHSYLMSVEGLGVLIGEAMALAHRAGPAFTEALDSAVIEHLSSEAQEIIADAGAGLVVVDDQLERDVRQALGIPEEGPS